MSIFDPTKIRGAADLADVLLQAVEDGTYISGQAIPSERAIAKRSGVSRTTVRRAIEVLVDRGILRRVPGAGTFVGSKRDVSDAQTMLGMIVPTLVQPYYAVLVRSIEREANRRGYQLLVGQSDYTSSGEANYLTQYTDIPGVKGLLVVPTLGRLPLEVYRYTTSVGKPFVFVSRSSDAVEADSVEPNRQEGARTMVKHLLDLGHRQIAYVRGVPPHADFHMAGYLQALEEAQVAEDARLIVSIDAEAEDAGRRGVRLLLERDAAFTAVFARNDLTATGVLKELQNAGLRVPQDVSVVGVDNAPASAHLQPPLTTLDSSLAEIGRMAVSFLFDRIDGRYNGPSRHLRIQQRMIERQSTAPPSSPQRRAGLPAAEDHSIPESHETPARDPV